MIIDDDTKRFIIHRLKWFALFIGVGFILVFLLPFPLDFISVTCLFALTYYLRSRSEMKRFGGSGRIRDLFGSFSSAFNDQYRPLKYYCMNCGKEHREIVCPICGSKAKRVGQGYLLTCSNKLFFQYFKLTFREPILRAHTEDMRENN